MQKVAIILTMILISGYAQAENNQDNWVFGGVICNSPTNCATLRENFDEIISIADQCVISQLAIDSGGESAFEDSRGLNSKDCLTAKIRARNEQGKIVMPLCCIVKTKDDLCQINCSSISIK